MKILIADDHWVVRESLKQVMRGVTGPVDVLEAASFSEAAAILADHPDIDLMLVDLVMPGFDAFDGLARLRREFPGAPIVVVSVHEDVDHVIRAMEHGAIGYIPKSAGGEEIGRALERVLAGEVWFPRRIIERSGAPAASAAEGPPRRPEPAAAPAPERSLELLTARETEVLALLGQGQSVKQIAAALALTSQTVRVHIGNAMKKLNLKDRAEIVHFAIRTFGGDGQRE